jgi:hypothetical protein
MRRQPETGWRRICVPSSFARRRHAPPQLVEGCCDHTLGLPKTKASPLAV